MKDSIFPMILSTLPTGKNIYNFLVYLTLSLLMVAMVGYDPVTIATPFILLIGFLFGYLRLRKLGFPPLFKMYNFIFITFAVVSFLWEPVWNWVIRFLSGVLFFYFLNLFINSKEKMKYIFFSIILGTLFSSFLGVLALTGFWDPGAMFFPVFQSFRFAGLYNTTMLGIFTSILILWVFDETLKPKLWVNTPLIKVVLLGILMIQLFATLTRSAWLGLLAGVVTYLSIEIYHSKLIKRLFVITGFLLISSTVMYLIINLEAAELIRMRIYEDSIYPTQGEEKRGEFYFTKNAIKLSLDNPFGVGIGNTQKNIEDFNGLEVGAHNNFVMVLSDMGWFTFLGFLFSQICIFCSLFSNALRSRGKYGLSTQMLLSNYIVLLTSGMFQDLILYIPMWLVPSLATVVIFGRSFERGGIGVTSIRSRLIDLRKV
jgi:hypothetical protein